MRSRRSLRMGMVALGCLAAASVGCGQTEAETEWAQGDRSAIAVCLNGAGGRNHEGNQVIDGLCRDLPGIVRDCSAETCWPSFRSSASASALVGVEDAWNQLDAQERERIVVAVLGYSWGGVNSVQLVRDLSAQGIPVQRYVLVDPFSPFGPDPLDVPAEAERTWVYRHSIAPASDCSNERRPVGPYEGFAPRCTEPDRCRDYDYSQSPLADVVGHCTVTDFARDHAWHNLTTGEDSGADDLPTPQAIEAY